MPTGVIVNALAVLIGGIVGGVGGKYLSEKFKTEINMIFGLASMTMGIIAIAPTKNMAAVIFALIIGTAVGLLLHMSAWINRGGVPNATHHCPVCPSKQDAFRRRVFGILVNSYCVVCFIWHRYLWGVGERDDWGCHHFDYKVDFGFLHRRYFCGQLRFCCVIDCRTAVRCVDDSVFVGRSNLSAHDASHDN